MIREHKTGKGVAKNCAKPKKQAMLQARKSEELTEAVQKWPAKGTKLDVAHRHGLHEHKPTWHVKLYNPSGLHNLFAQTQGTTCP